jgi:hypothetical protein
VSFSDGRKTGKIRDLDVGRDTLRDLELEQGGGDGNLFDRSGGSLLPSARTRRIQGILEDMEELSESAVLQNGTLADEAGLDEITPSKPSRHPEAIREPSNDISAFFRAQPAPEGAEVTVEEEEDHTISTRAFGQAPRSRNPTDATFLTECSFGVAQDQLVKVITDVQPFEPHWEELRSIDLRGKGAESVARLKDFLPRLEEINLSVLLLNNDYD